MPSPLIHGAAGYAIYRLYRSKEHWQHALGLKPMPLLAACIGLSVLPDIDAIPGLLLGDFGGFHNNLSHSILTTVLVSATAGAVAWFKMRSGFAAWFGLTFLCYGLHVVLDFFTAGRGVMLLWPISSTRFVPPFFLFYGLHWSDGLISVRHLWTLLTEAGTVVAVSLLTWLLLKWRSSQAKSHVSW